MTDSRVYTPAQPWYPPATPVEFPEGRLTPAWVGKVAKSKHGDIVIRSHLERAGIPLRWAPTEYQLGDSFTKMQLVLLSWRNSSFNSSV